MKQKRDLQAQINAKISTVVPSHAWRSTVALLAVHKPHVHLVGSGVLFSIGTAKFVVTAAHIIRVLGPAGKTMGVSDGTGSFYCFKGDWTISAPFQYGSVEDPFDVAVYRIPKEDECRFDGMTFLGRGDVVFDEPPPSTAFAIFGYPGSWSKPSADENTPLTSRCFEFVAHMYSGETEHFEGFDPRFHLLLDGRSEDLTFPDGSQADPKDLNGESIPFPKLLKGMSGCSVWMIGDFRNELDSWTPKQPKVVGIQSSVFPVSEILRAIRWVAVTTLIHSAFPDLRSTFNVWIPGQ